MGMFFDVAELADGDRRMWVLLCTEDGCQRELRWYASQEEALAEMQKQQYLSDLAEGR
jgi:hypothetical protein